MKGYAGKILRVNLTTGSIGTEVPPESFYRKYFGGTGFITYYLLKELPKGIDPLGPENILIFALGPMTGHPLPGSGRNSVGAKSPLTGGIGFSEAGGFWGAELKRAGFDAIIVEGRSEKPCYIVIRDGQAEIRDGNAIWGKTTGEVEDIIKKELADEHIRVAQCGIAGENKVRYACVLNDLSHAYGRGGMGAVMGSKNLRAIAVRGTESVTAAEPEKIRELARWFAEHKELWEGLKDTGTAGGVVSLHAQSALPTKNFQFGQFDGNEKISGQTLRDTLLVDRDNCYACPIHCKRVVKPGRLITSTLFTAGLSMRLSVRWALPAALMIWPPYAKVTSSVTLTALTPYRPESRLLLPWSALKGLLTQDQLDGLEARWKRRCHADASREDSPERRHRRSPCRRLAESGLQHR